jgi:hypothetical protein
MFRPRLSAPLVALSVALFADPAVFAAPVPAGGKPKDVSEVPVSADAVLVVQVNGVDRTKGRVLKMLEGVDAGVAKEAAAKIDEHLRELLEGRDLKGVDPAGRVFLAVGSFADLGNADPPVAVAIPVPDYKTFREKGLTVAERKSFAAGKDGVDEIEFEPSGQTLYLVGNKAGYVIATPNKETAEGYAGKFEPLTGKRLGTLADSFLAADVAVYLNVEKVNEVHGEQIQQGKQLFNLILQQGAGGLDKRQAEAARVVFDGLFQVIADAKGLVIAADARPEGANLRLDTAFQADTPSANVLAKEKPSPLAALNDLPKGMTAYSASRWGKAFADLQRALGGEFAAPDGDDKLAEAIENWTAAFAAADGESVTVAGSEMSTLSAAAFADPGKVTDAKLKMMRKLTGGATYSNLVLKQNPEVTEGDKKHAGFTLHAAGIEVDYAASVRDLADEAAKEVAIAAMKKLVPEKQTVWFGHDGKRFVQVSAKDWAVAKKLLDGFTDPKARVGDDPAFAATRKQLPAEAGYLSLFDTAETLGAISDYLGMFGEAVPVPGVELPRLVKPKGDPTFVGVAFTVQPRSARFDLFVPTGAVKAVRQAIE